MIAKGSGYVRGAGARARLVAHLKYIEHRAMSERETRDDRRIFSRDEDVVSRDGAVQDVMDHEHRGVAYHKIVLSPGQDEPVSDWREWAREIMDDLQERQGKQLYWIAVHHDNTDNPHVHVVLAGVGENLETGKPEQIRMYAPDYQFLRESGQKHSGHEQQREMNAWMREASERDAQELGVRDGKERTPLKRVSGRESFKGDFDR
jgi:type IV secretory pathway VirD2 relaxase